MVNVCSLQAGSGGHFLSLVMHHIIMDGMSMDIIMRELLAACASFQRKEPLQLPPLPVQYIDFTQWQQEQLSDEAWKPQARGLLLLAHVIVSCCTASPQLHP